MFERFEIGTDIVCIKVVDDLTINSNYKINGSGDLSWNHGTDKTGYGFCVVDESYAYKQGIKDWWKLPYAKKIKNYYFTLEEMDEYFITSYEDYTIHIRDKKLEDLLK